MPYYQRDLAFIHDRGFGLHGDRCAPGILDLLAPVRGGLVLELGCGSGALTRHLLAAGLRVIATDASPRHAGRWPGRPSASPRTCAPLACPPTRCRPRTRWCRSGTC